MFIPPKLEKLLGRVQRYHELAMSFQRRHSQSPGTDTGNKAYARMEHYEQKFLATLCEVEEEIEKQLAD